MPDIDMDFDSRYRDEMIRYAAERYGRDHVAQIITFGTIKARNAVRDAARVLGYPYGVGDKIAKAMPPLVMGRDTPLKYCFEQSPKYADGYKAAAELRAMYDTDPDVKRVVDVAKGLEGLKRSDGIHAAAVVITKDPVTDYLPIQRKPESGQDPADAPVVTQYEMHGVEDLGLLKMDFLGLRNLDVITDTRGDDPARRAIPTSSSTTISLDDRATFDLLVAGDTMGVFQLESPPMRQLLRALAPNTFEDVAALHRALPAGADERQHALRLRRPQERPQAGRVLPPRRRGGARRHVRPDDLSGERDAGRPEVRRLLARRGRQPAQGDGQEDPRGDGQGARRVRGGLRARRATASSSASSCSTSSRSSPTTRSTRATRYGYGLVTYQTAYLKAHYPVEYLACLLTSVKSNLDKAAVVPRRLPVDGHQGAHARRQPVGHRLRRARRRATCRPTSRCRSAARARSRSGCRRCATSARGSSSCSSPSATRTARSQSFHDFAERVPEPVLNKRTVESLIKAGAFDSLGHPRRGLLTVFEQIIDITVEPPARARPGRDEPVRRLGRRRRRRDERRASTSACRSPTSSSTRATGCGSRRRCSACTCPTTRCSASRRRCGARSSTQLADLPMIGRRRPGAWSAA